MIRYNLFFCSYKNELQKAKYRYNGSGKEKAAEYYIANEEVLKEKQKMNTETCQKNKKK